MRHRDYIIIQKIISELAVADEMIAGMNLKDFSSDEKTKRAVCMTVINVGELVKAVSDETRKKYSNIKWKEAAGFRDIAAHKYQTLNMDDVYNTVTQDFPDLKEKLSNILKNENDEKDK